MKPKVKIPLQEIYDMIYAGKYFTHEHEMNTSNSLELDPWSLIKSFTNTLENIFGEIISSYEGSNLPVIQVCDSRFNIKDKVRIMGNPIMRPGTAIIKYEGRIGVVLQILDNGNYWVGIHPSLPCAEFTEDSLKLME